MANWVLSVCCTGVRQSLLRITIQDIIANEEGKEVEGRAVLYLVLPYLCHRGLCHSNPYVSWRLHSQLSQRFRTSSGHLSERHDQRHHLWADSLGYFCGCYEKNRCARVRKIGREPSEE